MPGNSMRRLVEALVIVIAVLFFSAHLRPGHLSFIQHFISEYASSAPLSGLITVCMLLTGVTYLVVAFGALRTFEHGRASAAAVLGLALAGGALLFVAYYPTTIVQSPAAPQLLRDRIWNSMTRKYAEEEKNKAFKENYEKAIARVHDEMIGASMICLCGALAGFAVGFRRHPRFANVARLSFFFCPLIMTVFAAAHLIAKMAPRTTEGLFQRAGFALVLSWVWFAGRKLVSPPGSDVALPSAEDRAPDAGGGG